VSGAPIARTILDLNAQIDVRTRSGHALSAFRIDPNAYLVRSAV
jgi:hypothetical protein